MDNDIISMRDMGMIFEVTDAMGIDREDISVPLEKEDPGEVHLLDGSKLEIVIPLSINIEDWLDELMKKLETLGFVFDDNSS